MDLWMQLSSVGVGSACYKRLVRVAGGEGVQVGEDGLGNSQSDGQQPDHSHTETDAQCGLGSVDVQGFDNCFVPEKRRKHLYSKDVMITMVRFIYQPLGFILNPKDELFTFSIIKIEICKMKEARRYLNII